jgi:peptidyl-tRNA hydrolase, PTH1 family
MNYILIGLGNPGSEYAKTPHNIGRELVEYFVQKNNKKAVWKVNKKAQALVTKIEVGNVNVLCVLPETFMNNSGVSAKALVVGEKNIARMIVVHDDLDLPLGTLKLSFNRGSGGHNGIKSITKALKTEMYIRLRVGISPHTAKGEVKKPSGEDAVVDFILKPFAKKYADELKDVQVRSAKILRGVCEDGLQLAMTHFN